MPWAVNKSTNCSAGTLLWPTVQISVAVPADSDAIASSLCAAPARLGLPAGILPHFCRNLEELRGLRSERARPASGRRPTRYPIIRTVQQWSSGTVLSFYPPDGPSHHSDPLPVAPAATFPIIATSLMSFRARRRGIPAPPWPPRFLASRSE